MHAVHLPPRDLWSSAALAVLLTLAIMALLLVAAPQLTSDSSPKVSTPQTQTAVPRATPPAAEPSEVSSSFKPLEMPTWLLEASQADYRP
jgi:hypothetical protein